MSKPEKTPEELARDYAHWIAPELIDMLEKALIFIKEHPEMFPSGEEEHTIKTIKEMREMLDEEL